MQQRHIRLNDRTQGGSPFPFYSDQGEPVGNNSPIRSRTYSMMRNGLGLPRSAMVNRFGFALHELNAGGYYNVWSSGTGLTNLDTYKDISSATNGATSDDIGCRKMFGHVDYYASTSPDPVTLAGSDRADWEFHMYPNGVHQGSAECQDQNGIPSWHDPHMAWEPSWTNLGGATITEGTHAFTLITDDNLVFECDETYNVYWLDGGGSTVATFTVHHHLLCDTDDEHFPNYGGAGTVNRVMPGRSIGNARFASDYFAALWQLYQDHGIDHNWVTVPVEATIGGAGMEAACYIDGHVQFGPPDVTTIYSAPFRAALTVLASDGGFGFICPAVLGLQDEPNYDSRALIGYDIRVPVGTYTLDEWQFGLGNNLVSGPSTTTPASDSWWIPIDCEADNSMKHWLPHTGAGSGIDYTRLEGWCPRPPPSGESIVQANLSAPDLAF